jgi:hypothetical protein
MQRKRRLFILLATIGIILTLLSVLNSLRVPQSTTAQTTEEDPMQNDLPDNVNRPELVVPEAPLGTLGLISAIAMGFGVFTLISKRRN